MVKAAKSAIGRAKARGSEAVTLDDLLVGVLSQFSRFGIARIGPWVIDLADLAAAEPPNGAAAVRPAYTAEVVRLFESAARIARLDGASSIELIHLLVAYAHVEEGLARELRERLSISPVDWRAALADWDLPSGDRPREAGPRAGGSTAREKLELFTTEEAAAFLSVHPQTIRTYIRTGKLPAYRLAGERKIRIQRGDLLSLLEPVMGDDDGSEERS